MNFTPRSEKEIAEAGLLAKGTYPFEVIDAVDSVSKKGDEMIEAQLRIFQPDGKTRQLTAYLMEAIPARLFHFCTYCGLAAEYGAGTLDAGMCVGKTGYVKISIKEDKTGTYPPQNNIVDFVRPPALTPGAAPHPAASQSNDGTEGDVPY